VNTICNGTETKMATKQKGPNSNVSIDDRQRINFLVKESNECIYADC